MTATKAGVLVGIALLALGTGFAAAAAPTLWVLEAEDARLAPERTEIVRQESFPGKKGVALKSGVAASVDTPGAAADLVFTVQVPQAGRYSLTTQAATDEAGAAQMRRAKTKFESLFLRIQVGTQRPTRRVVFVPWSSPELCTQQTGVFELAGGAQEIRLWLPAGVRLDRLEVRPFRPPTVPAEAAAYRPAIVPPAAHPRLWVNADSLALIRANLEHPENKSYWERVRTLAAKPFNFIPGAEEDVAYNTPLEQAAVAKAFAYLMRGDARVGRDATGLMLAYLPRVEFGNLLDVTREVGAAIYAAACVYDWCYDLLSASERDLLRRHLMRLADEMECGWPPFRQSIINGHGNEAVINRDLLALAIAVHNEDPLPYQYCAYAILEQLVPMRRFEYQSPRHNQGTSYSAFRFGWEMHGAWLFRRMTGREVFDANIKRVPQYWLHLRLPNGEMMRDGDGVPSGPYWKYSRTALLCYAYNGDPVLKGEFLRQGGIPENPVLFLLLNDPALKAEPALTSLPTTIDFGPVLGGMIARTGWKMGADSAEVVAEIKGGGYHFGNHQHADAGSLQIYYRGLQVAKLGQYTFYGTPYDLNFAKRSVAQSMLLVVDPQETFGRNLVNDGGSRFIQTNPRTPRQAMTDPMFNYGRVMACSFGPDAQTPDFSFFAADLRGAYSDKVSACVRRFCFLNLHRPGNPAAIILLDDITARDPGFKKYWQLTTLNPPQSTPEGVLLSSESGGVTGRLDVRLLDPVRAERTVEIVSGPDLHRVDGRLFTPPTPAGPEANGYRIRVSPTQPRAHDRFLSVLQACDAAPLPIANEETDDLVIIRIADRLVVLGKGTSLIERPLELTVPGDAGAVQVLVAGLKAGAWRIVSAGAPAREATVAEGKNTLHFESRGGRYQLTAVALR